MDSDRAIAIVGLGAVLPEAPSVTAFWNNVIGKRYCISEVPPERWAAADYYDPDIKTPDKTYSKIGGWVRGFQFDWKRFRIPPRVANAMDQGQQWAVTIAADALLDYGYPERPLNTERTAVILGTAMGGELHYATNLRVSFPEYVRYLEAVPEYQALPGNVRSAMLTHWHDVLNTSLPPVTEDSMPGELPNIVSGRVANVLDLHGPNFITDAACAASLAALNAAIEMLAQHEVDAVITGGVDRNMGVSTFVKFCKIGALSATGSRPFGDGADGFVMGEGSAAFLLKRLDDAERAGDRIYAVIRGIGGSSDGHGKGITAPNPVGQVFAIQRAWENAGLDPATASLVEAHGTSTKVGDVVEVESLTKVFGNAAKPGSIALGSVKSNIGHLKAGAGAAGLLKATLALHHKILPPTLNSERPNPNIDFAHSPFYLNHEAREWNAGNTPRRAGVSAYGFGGTNFHVILEEHVPGLLTGKGKSFAGVSVSETPEANGKPTNGKPTIGRPGGSNPTPPAAPPRGILALGGAAPKELAEKLDAALKRVQTGWTPPVAFPSPLDLQAPERLMIDFGDHDELLSRLQTASKAMGFDNPQAWRAMQPQGIFRGSGRPQGKVAFMFPGQGSQYVNMGRDLVQLSPIVAEVFKEADAVMTPILGRPLTSYIFVDGDDKSAIMQAEFDLMQTAITQPAMLTLDIAIYRLLEAYGFKPDMVMGHSLGEYAALIVAGIMPFADALEAAAARGSEMSKVSMGDNGQMAAVIAPLDVVEATLKEVDGYVVPANINSRSQCVIGGASDAVQKAIALFEAKGFKVVQVPVSHAFHTQIVAPASEPLRRVLDRLHIAPPSVPLVANVTGDLYPTQVESIKDILQKQIASPVQWVKGLQTLYASGVRTFVESGPKRALKGFADDVFGGQSEVQAFQTCHPKQGELASLNQALCGLYAAGYFNEPAPAAVSVPQPVTAAQPAPQPQKQPIAVQQPEGSTMPAPTNGAAPLSLDSLTSALAQALQNAAAPRSFDRNDSPAGSVVVTGTGLGLPGAEKPLMAEDNAMRILHGEQFVDLIPERFRKGMLAKRITRLVKSEDGSGRFETLTDPNEVIKLAARPGAFDLSEEYGVPAKLVEALDVTTQLAMAAGLDALREAGIPLVQTYRATTTGKHLPERWMLPQSLRDETGVIFASAFPGGDRYADEFTRYFNYQNRVDQLNLLEDLRRYTTDDTTLREINRRITSLREVIEAEPYEFDRRFIFRILAMGHSQFAEYIGARGPNTHVNAACASTTQAIGVAEDWIRAGRCRRVIIVAGDDVTSDRLMEWVGAGFLATGAAATDDRVEEAALPFDRRRHGTILGMGACALVVESEDAVRERGMRGLVEVLSTESRNSAYHGTRLDIDHISMVMETLVTAAERRFGLHRQAMAPQTVFMSHETFTPARGGSASAEIKALRQTFGAAASEIIIANTKGFTGHPMGVGVEDVISVKILEYGIVPPVPNFKEIDPDLGPLNLSRGGRYPVQYVLHLSAGFGSQIALALTRRIPGGLNRIDNAPLYQHWLDAVSGYDNAQTEVVKRTLRIVEHGFPTHAPAPSGWRYGTGPLVRTPAGDSAAPGEFPAHMAYQPTSVPPSYTPPAAPEVRPTPKPVSVSVPEARPEPVAVIKVEAPAPAPVAPAPAMQTAPAATTVPVVVPAPVPVASRDTLVDKVLEIVAAQTGYPVEMLDPELDMEADLGIDTVKQAETFAAIRAAFDIPRRDDIKLRDYPTLAKVIDFVRAMRPDLVKSPAAAPVLEPAAAVPVVSVANAVAVAEAAQDPVNERVLEIVAAQTGYPVEMLELDLDMEADLGIDTVKQAETFAAIRAAFEIPRRDDIKLRDYPTLAKVIEFVRTMRPELSAQAVPVAPVAVAAAVTVPAAVPVAPTPVTPASAPADDPIEAKVLEIVAAQTGYPVEMLELDLDMEADLGIDTVKQAETFAAIRAAFEIPRRDDIKLRDYPTLAKVIEFVRTMRPELAQPVKADAAAVQPAPASAADEPSADVVTAKVLEIVANQTGYPQEMLELDLDMEADLGIDTVKQAETFAAIRAAFDIPRRDDIKLRDYPTLAKVIEFVRISRPELVQPVKAEVAVVQPAPASAAPVSAAVAASLEAADLIPRRVPVPSLRPSLEWCKPTGVVLDASSRVIVVLDEGGVGKALAARLQKRGVNVLPVEPGVDSDALEAQVKAWLAEGTINGVYWLPALDAEPALELLDLAAWRELNRVRVKNFAITMRALYDAIKDAGTFVVAATRLGGLHGYGEAGASAPLGGGVVGFAKAYKREHMDVLVKAVDFEISRKTADPADALIAETLNDPGVVEVGYHNENRYTVTLEERPAADGKPGLMLDKDTVFVVTGAAGGITSAIVGDLAAASGGIFYLLDLVKLPDANDPKIILFRTDKDALKARLIDEAKAAGEKPTPVQIDKQVMAIEREEAALRAVETVQAAGGRAYYHSVNLLDGAAVTVVVDEIRSTYGRIDALVHAGGIEISRSLGDKDQAQFNLVYDIKADGFFCLLRAAKGMPIGATVAFSSVAGRFGNSGQTDYSAANDLLCKVTSSLRQWRPETRGIVIDWTAWGGIGMATRGSIPRIMQMAGIDMLPPESGIPTVRRELVAGGFKGEIVVGQALGILGAEFDPDGGLDVAKAQQWAAEHHLGMIGVVKAAKLYGGLEVETVLDPKAQPFLYDHQIDGTPVLPGVMGTEAFAELASVLAPGYRVAEVFNEDFHSPFKFYRHEPGTLYLSATAQPAADGDLIAAVTLRSVRALAGDQTQEKVHFTASVRLTRAEAEAPSIAFAPPADLPISRDAIYRIYFHGPAYQVMQAARVDGDTAIGLMASHLPPNSSPADAALLVAPRLIEFVFQTAGVWEMKTKGVMALPLAIRSVEVFRAPTPGATLYSVVRAVWDGFDAQVVDEGGVVLVTVSGYRTVQLPGSVTI